MSSRGYYGKAVRKPLAFTPTGDKIIKNYKLSVKRYKGIGSRIKYGTTPFGFLGTAERFAVS
jgi:hypothetical protein